MTDKQTQDTLQIVNFRLTAAEIVQLDQIAEKLDLTRSQLIRNMVTSGMEEFALFNKIGIVKAMLTVRDVMEMIGSKKNSTPEDLDKGNSSKA